MVNISNCSVLIPSHYGIAKKWVLADGCADSISVNIEHTGEEVKIMPCSYDGSAYVICDCIGVMQKEIALVRCMFINYHYGLFIVDSGNMAFKGADGEAYILSSTGNVHKATEEEKSKIYWYRYDMKSLIKSTEYYTKIQSNNMNEQTVDKYLFNFIYTFSLRYESDCFSLKYYGISDVLTEGYGLKFTTKTEIQFDDEDEEDEAEEEIELPDEEDEDEEVDEDDYDYYDRDDDEDEEIYLDSEDEDTDEDEDEDDIEEEVELDS